MSEFKHTILCVDDEENILHSLKRLLRKDGYRLLFANSGSEGLDVLKANEVHLVISDQRMPEMSGTDFLACVKDQYPDILRIILTGYTDVDSITESINKGHIYKFYLKPWNDQNLKLEIRQALEQFDLIRANKKLDETVVKQNRQLQKINENLEDLVGARTREIALKNQALELSHAILEDLPVAVLGVDCDGIIVLANKMAQDMVASGELNIGFPMDRYFGDGILAKLTSILNDGKQIEMTCRTIKDKPFNAVLMPLSGHYQGKGMIVTLHP